MAKEKLTEQGFKAEQYSYNVAWSESDGLFIGRVTEFPSLAAHGRSQEKALREIRAVVAFVIEDLISDGETVPAPLGKRNFSGRLNLRMPKDLHRRLTLESELQGVSLNTLINSKLQR